MTQCSWAWADFPAEIRDMILGLLARAEYYEGASLVSYSTVSKNWQPVFERLTFREIYVKSCDLDGFQAIFRGVRRSYVRYIGLNIELTQERNIPSSVLYGTDEDIAMAQMLLITRHGPDAHRFLPPLQEQQTQNNIMFTNTLHAFLSRLSLWGRDEVCRDGLALEIIASSESHWQKMARRIRQRQGPRVIILRTSGVAG